MATKPEVAYHYRGLIERGPRYEWREGYSENLIDGQPLYPWNTRGECRREAASRDLKAVFYRDGKRESTKPRRRPVSRQWRSQAHGI